MRTESAPIPAGPAAPPPAAPAIQFESAVLPPEAWRTREAAHRLRVQQWVAPRLARRQRGAKHPVDDFLFEYYRLRPAQLLAWHPGWRHEVEDHPQLQRHPAYMRRTRGWGVDPGALAGRIPRLEASIRLLRATSSRPPAFGCFGMHEWAMVYRTDRVRHRQVPLRISAGQIADTVETVGLRCTHFDAYRFFTAAAQPLQAALTRRQQPDYEQPGCVHAGMDLYRWAYEALPLLASEVVADCFGFARAAREIDMRASPYDLSAWGLAPIAVETADGRREYAAEQQALTARAQPLRAALLAELAAAHAWLAGATPATA